MIFLTYSGLANIIAEFTYFITWISSGIGNDKSEREELSKYIELDLAQILPRFWGLSYLVVIV